MTQPDIVTAHTDRDYLILHNTQGDSGLMDMWNLGIPMNKWTVAAALAADCNGTALAQRIRQTGRIY